MNDEPISEQKNKDWRQRSNEKIDYLQNDGVGQNAEGVMMRTLN